MWGRNKKRQQEATQLRETGESLHNAREVEVGLRQLELERNYRLQDYYTEASKRWRGVDHMDRTDQSKDFAILLEQLQEWLESTLWEHRRMVLADDMFEELRDGYVLTELLDILDPENSNTDDRDWTSQTEQTSMAAGKISIARLQGALARVGRVLFGDSSACNEDNSSYTDCGWSVESVSAGEELSIVRLLLALVEHYRCPVDLPNVKIKVTRIYRRRDMHLRVPQWIQLTGGSREKTENEDDQGKSYIDEHNVFFESSPIEAKALLASMTDSFREMVAASGIALQDVALDLSDGIILLHVVSLIGGFFLRIGSYCVPIRSAIESIPLDLNQKTSNVRLALDCLQGEGVSLAGVTIDDVLRSDPVTLIRLSTRIRQKLAAGAVSPPGEVQQAEKSELAS